MRSLDRAVQLRQLSNGRVYFSNLTPQSNRKRKAYVISFVATSMIILTLAIGLLGIPRVAKHSATTSHSKRLMQNQQCEPTPGQSFEGLSSGWSVVDGSEITLGALKQVEGSIICGASKVSLKLVLLQIENQWLIEKVTRLN